MTDLRIGRDRVRLYGIGLALIGLTQLRFAANVGHYWDWVDFYNAGSMAGTRALVDPAGHAAWGAAHGLPVTAFAYMPAFAWLLAPFAHLSIPVGFALNAVLMSLAAVAAAWVYSENAGRRGHRTAKTPNGEDTGRREQLTARIPDGDGRVDFRTALYMTMGWAPVVAAIVTGQNSPLGLLLSLVAIDGLSRGDELRAGIGVAALCYKPTYALPFGVLLLVFRKWKAIGVVAACGVVWYASSALAAGGDWAWPRPYLQSLSEYVGPDFAYNRFKSVSLPGVLMLAGMSSGAALAIGLAALVASLVALRRRIGERSRRVAGADLIACAGVADRDERYCVGIARDSDVRQRTFDCRDHCLTRRARPGQRDGQSPLGLCYHRAP